MIVLEYGKKNLHRRFTYTCPFCDSKLQFDDDDKDVKFNKYSFGSTSQTEAEGKCLVCKTDFKLNLDVNVSPGVKEEPVWK